MRTLSSLLVLALRATPPSGADGPARPPDILLILADDLAARDAGFVGGDTSAYDEGR